MKLILENWRSFLKEENTAQIQRASATGRSGPASYHDAIVVLKKGTTVDILDENEESIDKRDWEDFYEALPGMDTAELRDRTTFSTGVDSLKEVVCPYCETDYSGTIPMGPEFFRF